MCYRLPQNTFFPRTCDHLVSEKTMHTLFPTLYPLSTEIFATATVLTFVQLRDSGFNFHCYTQREARPTQKSAWKSAATSRDFLRKRLQSTFTLANQLRWITQERYQQCTGELISLLSSISSAQAASVDKMDVLKTLSTRFNLKLWWAQPFPPDMTTSLDLLTFVMDKGIQSAIVLSQLMIKFTPAHVAINSSFKTTYFLLRMLLYIFSCRWTSDQPFFLA